MPDTKQESTAKSKSLRTILFVLGFFVLTAAATAVEIALKSHQQRPFLSNVVALGLLNINVLLLVVLLLLIGRQFVKFYFERKKSPFGAGFRSKLVLSYMGLTVIPASVMFVVTVGLLTGGIKYWFSPNVENTVKDSIALVESYKTERAENALHYALSMAERLRGADTAKIVDVSDDIQAEYRLDMVEVYKPNGGLIVFYGHDKDGWARSGKKFVFKALEEGRASETAAAKKGTIVRGASVFYDSTGRKAGVVVASYILSSVISDNIGDITHFYEDYWNLRTFKNPIKESFTLSFILITLVVVFAALWFGLYISKSITGPITTLAEATQSISQGNYDIKIDIQAQDELGALVTAFNRMARDLKGSQERLTATNLTLHHANDLLEQRRQFIEMVLENINTGVITIDRAGKLTLANRATLRVLNIQPDDIIGKNYREVFEFHQLDEIREQVRALVETGGSVQKDIQLAVGKRTLSLRLHVSTLHDTQGAYLGILVVFDDLTELMKAQRSAAWKEVAKRIAHEIKNPLTPIQLSAQRLRKKYLEGNGGYEDIIKDCTETIIAQVDGMKHLVDEFSKFARMPESEPAPNDMHAIIDEAASLYLSAHKDVTIIKEYDGTLPILSVDKEQMKRVFVNLFDNAVAAMDGKG
ncbi:MAG TPA: HAMP domain-containing protein, partial [Nitrospirota bacterium]